MRWLELVAIGLGLSVMTPVASAAATCEAPRCLDIEVIIVAADDRNNGDSESGGDHGASVPSPADATGPSPGDDDWFAAQLRHANRLFAPLGAGFRVASKRTVSGPSRIRTRQQRDALARHPRSPGAITVFLVGALDDVDVDERMLRGVHWRLRSDRDQTWIILSALDDTGAVLAHELGHYFGLPHSRRRRSVMNKSPHEDPAFVDRVFTAPDLRALRTGLRERFPPATPGHGP